MKNSKIIVLDFETVGLDPYTTDPCQVGAVVIDKKTLTILPDVFESKMKPDPTLIDKSTLSWHAKLHKGSEEEICKGCLSIILNLSHTFSALVPCPALTCKLSCTWTHPFHKILTVIFLIGFVKSINL